MVVASFPGLVGSSIGKTYSFFSPPPFFLQRVYVCYLFLPLPSTQTHVRTCIRTHAYMHTHTCTHTHTHTRTHTRTRTRTRTRTHMHTHAHTHARTHTHTHTRTHTHTHCVSSYGPKPNNMVAFRRTCTGLEESLSECSEVDSFTCDFYNSSHFIAMTCNHVSNV